MSDATIELCPHICGRCGRCLDQCCPGHQDTAERECGASVSGTCLQLTEGFTACRPGDCERDMPYRHATREDQRDAWKQALTQRARAKRTQRARGGYSAGDLTVSGLPPPPPSVSAQGKPWRRGRTTRASPAAGMIRLPRRGMFVDPQQTPADLKEPAMEAGQPPDTWVT